MDVSDGCPSLLFPNCAVSDTWRCRNVSLMTRQRLIAACRLVLCVLSHTMARLYWSRPAGLMDSEPRSCLCYIGVRIANELFCWTGSFEWFERTDSLCLHGKLTYFNITWAVKLTAIYNLIFDYNFRAGVKMYF